MVCCPKPMCDPVRGALECVTPSETRMFQMMNAARYAVGLQGVGISERAYQQALSFAKERVQSQPVDGTSNRAVTIIHHPDVRRLLARMRAITEGTRAMAAFTAGWQELASVSETAAEQSDAARLAEFLVPLVKGYSTEMAVDVASSGVQVHAEPTRRIK